jgi:hypothetical protein
MVNIYNQNAGNTGFIIASGMWFEANLDQRAVADLREGMDATVNLEALCWRSEIIIALTRFNERCLRKHFRNRDAIPGAEILCDKS